MSSLRGGTILAIYLVEFTPKCVSDFERTNHLRITADTVNTIFIIGDVNLVYKRLSEVQQNWKLNLAIDSRLKSIPVLVINQCYVFDMDQIGTTKVFPYVYKHEKFLEIAFDN